MDLLNKNLNISKNITKWLAGFVFLGIIVLVYGMFLVPERVWSNILLNGIFLTCLGFCGIMFVAIHYVSNAGWDVIIRRVPEGMFSILSVGFVFMIATIFGMGSLYIWSNPEIVQNDILLKGKVAWLNPTGFTIRMVVYFFFWYFVGKKILKHSKKQDKTGDIRHSNINRRWSAFFLYIGGIFFVGSSFDWIMSLEPHWFSTIFGMYNFSGMFTSGLAAMIILLVYLRKRGVFGKLLKDDHLFELGRYLFAFTTFWGYIWFCQHMLIWYANIPEETVYYIKRNLGVYGSLMVLNVCLNWLFPFVILLFRKTKRDGKYLVIASLLVLAGRWTDLYLMIFPSQYKTPVFGVIEIGMFLASISVFIWIFFKAFEKSSPIPEKDPYLEESKAFHA